MVAHPSADSSGRTILTVNPPFSISISIDPRGSGGPGGDLGGSIDVLFPDLASLAGTNEGLNCQPVEPDGWKFRLT